MKNIHILSTDKPSRLFLKKSTLLLNNQYTLQKVFPKGKCQNIYITSDEEIKEVDIPCWVISDIKKAVPHKLKDYQYKNLHTYKKIILTTDQDLIKNNIQAIDYEFLEWFVKNPSYESVDVKKEKIILGEIQGTIYIDFIYKIIIPKEEPKQEIDMSKYTIGIDPYGNQEALEKAAMKHSSIMFEHEVCDSNVSFKADAKWQQKQDKNRYSEEEVLELLKQREDYCDDLTKDYTSEIEDWFEQFKKK